MWKRSVSLSFYIISTDSEWDLLICGMLFWFCCVWTTETRCLLNLGSKLTVLGLRENVCVAITGTILGIFSLFDQECSHSLGALCFRSQHRHCSRVRERLFWTFSCFSFYCNLKKIILHRQMMSKNLSTDNLFTKCPYPFEQCSLLNVFGVFFSRDHDIVVQLC